MYPAPRNHYQELIEIKQGNHLSNLSSSSLSSLSENEYIIHKKEPRNFANSKTKKVRFKKRLKKSDKELHLTFNQNEYDSKQAKKLSHSFRLILSISAFIVFTFYTFSLLNFHTKLSLLHNKVDLISSDYIQISENFEQLSKKVEKSVSHLEKFHFEEKINQIEEMEKELNQSRQTFEALSSLPHKVQSLDQDISNLKTVVNQLKTTKQSNASPIESSSENIDIWQKIFAKIVNKQAELEERLNLTMLYVQAIHDRLFKENSQSANLSQVL